jgi:hypothetical protein
MISMIFIDCGNIYCLPIFKMKAIVKVQLFAVLILKILY